MRILHKNKATTTIFSKCNDAFEQMTGVCCSALLVQSPSDLCAIHLHYAAHLSCLLSSFVNALGLFGAIFKGQYWGNTHLLSCQHFSENF